MTAAIVPATPIRSNHVQFAFMLKFGVAMTICFAISESCIAGDPVPLTPSKTTLRDLVREKLRVHAIAGSDQAKADAATELCDLYFALRQDERYDLSPMIIADATKIRRRLIGIARDYENELKRNLETKRVLTGGGSDFRTSARSNGMPDAINGAAAGTAWDASSLVDLIQQITDPDFWDVRGGPGSIRYFALRRVLVVRATTDVHEQVRDLLTALR